MPYACVFFSLKKTGDDQRRKGVDRYGYDSAKKGADLRGAGTIQKNEDRSVCVPGHKHGRGNPELVELLGSKCVGIDVNSMKPLDNLCHPVSVIKEAEELAAEAFGAAHAF